ncbi:MAG: hypothetical protein Kow0098_21190 [Ignavibacteriaceae bacterium]
MNENLKYKVLQISFGDGYAGSAKMAVLSSSLLINNDFDVMLLVSTGSLTEKRAAEENISLKTFNTKINFKEIAKQVLNYVGEFNPDFIISYHSLDRKVAVHLRKKLSSNFVNIAYRQNMSRSFPLIGSWIYNRYFDYQLACSRGVAEDLIRSGAKRSKVYVIHNTTEFPDKQNPDRRTLMREKLNILDKIVLGVSSWFHKERKGFDILFEAFSKTDDKCVLLIIGIPAENQGEVIEFARSFGIDKNRIIMPGFIDNIYDYYNAMDIFIIPSRSEGFSLALLEAAASGLPLIASDIPGNNELVINGETGLLFDLNKENDLKQKIDYLISHKEEAVNLGKNAKKYTIENFSPDVYSKKLTMFLKNII